MLLLASGAFQSQHNLLCHLGLLLEHRLRLTTITCLLAIITTLSLDMQRWLACSVFGNLVCSVLVALSTVRIACLWNIDLIMDGKCEGL